MSVGLVTISMWIGMSGFGVLVSLVNLRAARADFKHQSGQQDRRWQRALIAQVNYANEYMRTVAHVGLFWAGTLIARGQIDPSPPPVSLYVRGVILFVIAVFVAQTLTHRWLRHRLTKQPQP